MCLCVSHFEIDRQGGWNWKSVERYKHAVVVEAGKYVLHNLSIYQSVQKLFKYEWLSTNGFHQIEKAVLIEYLNCQIEDKDQIYFLEIAT